MFIRPMERIFKCQFILSVLIWRQENKYKFNGQWKIDFELKASLERKKLFDDMYC